MGCGLILAEVLIVQLFYMNNFTKRSELSISPFFTVLAALTNVLAALAFGKPYTSMIITGVGLALSIVLCIGLLGLWEWSERFNIAALPIELGIYYFKTDGAMVVDLNDHFVTIKLFLYFSYLFVSFLLCKTHMLKFSIKHSS